MKKVGTLKRLQFTTTVHVRGADSEYICKVSSTSLSRRSKFGSILMTRAGDQAA